MTELAEIATLFAERKKMNWYFMDLIIITGNHILWKEGKYDITLEKEDKNIYKSICNCC